MSIAGSIARLKITLDDVEPRGTRRIEVPLGLRLDRLRLVMQAALGWASSHLWEFRVRDVGWGRPDPGYGFGGGPLDARKATLLDVLEDTGAKTIKYLYDFGDGWQHSIRIERIAPADPQLVYPRLLEAQGCCPPEDIGGPPGHAEFLEAVADPAHERHAELREWHGDSFDPAAVDVEAIAAALAVLAVRKQSRRAGANPSTRGGARTATGGEAQSGSRWRTRVGCADEWG